MKPRRFEQHRSKSSMMCNRFSDFNVNGTGWRVAELGAGWAYGLSAGAFCWILNDASSDRYRTIGGRLVYRKKVAA